MNVFIFLALSIALIGCGLVYLASPNQRWRAAALPARPARGLGGLLLLGSLVIFLWNMQATTAVFTFTVCVMLMFMLLPYAAVLVSLQKGR